MTQQQPYTPISTLNPPNIMHDQPDKLSALLREWQPEPPPSENVRREVWTRIKNRRIHPIASCAAWLDQIFGKPLVATGVLAIAVTVGVMIGTQASSSAQTASYLQSVSAILQAR